MHHLQFKNLHRHTVAVHWHAGERSGHAATLRPGQRYTQLSQPGLAWTALDTVTGETLLRRTARRDEDVAIVGLRRGRRATATESAGQGRIGRDAAVPALRFDGIDDVVTVPGSPSLDAPWSLTVEAWIFAEPTAREAVILEKVDPSTGCGLTLGLSSSGRLQGQIRLGALDVLVHSQAPIPTRVWTHVAVVFDATTHALRCHVNGAPAGAAMGARRRPGTNATALDLDAPDIELTTKILLDHRAGTTSLWFQTTAPDGGLFCARHAGRSDRDVYLDHGRLCARLGDERIATAPDRSYADGAWHRLQHVFGATSGAQALFVDGERVAVGTQTQATFGGASYCTLGRASATPAPFIGELASASVWSVAADAPEERWCQDPPPGAAGLVAWWKLDEGSGSWLRDSSGRGADIHGAGDAPGWNGNAWLAIVPGDLAIPATAAPLQIGAGDRRAFAGAIRDLRLWDMARSDDAIAGDYNRRLAGGEPGLAAYWRCDQGAGNELLDGTGHGHTGRFGDGRDPATAPRWTRSRLLLMDGLQFAGSDVVVPPPMEIETRDGLSLEAWVGPDLSAIARGAAATLFACGSATDGVRLEIHADASVTFATRSAGVTAALSTGAGVLARPRLSHVSCTIDARGQARIHINGAAIAAGRLGLPAAGTWTQAAIGEGYTGVIDEVRFWCRSRPIEEIQAYMGQVLEPGDRSVIAVWSFDEGSGSVAHDSGPMAYDALLGSATEQAPAWMVDTHLVGAGLWFDGEDDLVLVEDANGWGPPPYTLELWMKPTGQPEHDWVGVAGLESADFSLRWYADGSVCHASSSVDGWPPASPPGSAPVGRWTHVAITHDERDARIFVDGVQVAVKHGTGVSRSGGGPFLLGTEARGSGRCFPGQIAEVRLWRVARSAEQLLASMHARLDPATSGLEAYWPADAGAGDTLAELVSGADGSLGAGVASAKPLWVESPHLRLGGMIFDGAKAAALVDAGPSLAAGSGFSITAWIQATQTDGLHGILVRCATVSTVPYALSVDGDRLRFDYGGPGAAVVHGGVVDAGWHHVAATVTTADRAGQVTISLYLDGLEVATQRAPALTDVPASQVAIGAWAGAVQRGWFFGRIDSVVVWRSALTAAEVADAMHTRPAPGDPRCAASWRPATSAEGRIPDTSGNENHARVTCVGVLNAGTPAPTAPAVAFDGSDLQRMEIPDSPALAATDDAYTIELWVRPDATRPSTAQALFTRAGASCNLWLEPDGALAYRPAGDGSLVPNTAPSCVPPEVWTHVAITFDGSTGEARTFVNGAPAAVGQATSRSAQGGAPFRVAGPFAGEVAGVRIWSVARRSDEIAAAMHVLPDPLSEGLCGYWLPGTAAGQVVRDLGPSHGDAALFGGPRQIVATSLSLAPAAPAAPPLAQALRLDGSGQQLTGAATFGNAARTLCLWMRTLCPGCGVFEVSGDEPTVGLDFCLYLEGGELRITSTGLPDLAGRGFRVADGAWHHVAYVLDRVAGAHRLYLDGACLDEAPVEIALADEETARFVIGAGRPGSTSWFRGALADLSIWTSAASAAQIADRMKQRVAAPAPELLAAWDFTRVDGAPRFGAATDCAAVGDPSAAPDDVLALAGRASLLFRPEQSVRLGTPAAVLPPGAFTVEGWVWRGSATGTLRLLGELEGDVWLGVSGGVPLCHPGQALPATAALAERTWTHLAWVVEPGEAEWRYTIYIDGERALDAATGPAFSPDAALGLRAAGDDCAFRVSEVRLWQAARPRGLITRDRPLQLEGPRPGLAGRWRLDEVEGGWARDSGPLGLHGWIGQPTARVAWEGPPLMTVGGVAPPPPRDLRTQENLNERSPDPYDPSAAAWREAPAPPPRLEPRAGGDAQTVDRGVSLVSTLRLDADGQGPVAAFLHDFLGLSSIEIVFGASRNLFEMEIPINWDNERLGDAPPVTFDSLRLSIQLKSVPRETLIRLVVVLRAYLRDQRLKLTGSIGVEQRNARLLVTGAFTMEGSWIEPFGFRGVVLSDVAVQLGLTPVQPFIASFGLAGKLRLGAAALSTALLVDVARPSQTMLHLRAENVALGDVVDTLSGPDTTVPAALRETVRGIIFRIFELSIVPEPVAIGALRFDDTGLTVQASMTLWGWSARVYLRADYSDGLTAYAAFDRVSLGGVFEVTESLHAPARLFTCSEHSQLVQASWDDREAEPATCPVPNRYRCATHPDQTCDSPILCPVDGIPMVPVAQHGARLVPCTGPQLYLRLAPYGLPRLFVSGRIDMLGVVADVAIDVSDVGLSFRISGSVWGLFEAEVDVRVTMDFEQIRAHGVLRNDFYVTIQARVIAKIEELARQVEDGVTQAQVAVDLAQEWVDHCWREVERQRQEVRRERQAAIDELNEARATVARWQADVNGWLGEIQALEDWYHSLPATDWPWNESKASEWWWVGPRLAWLNGQYYLASLALRAAESALRLAAVEVESFPVDLDPRVGAAILQYESALVALQLAKGALQVTLAAAQGAAAIASSLATMALGQFFSIRRASFEAVLSGNDETDRQVAMSADIVFLGQVCTLAFDFDFGAKDDGASVSPIIEALMGTDAAALAVSAHVKPRDEVLA